jgi:outer membrane protein assembly factor BamB
MSADRDGLTQPIVAYGMVYVADIFAQRIVALDARDGREKWVYHVGSRVDFPPTISWGQPGSCVHGGHGRGAREQGERRAA